MILDKKFYPIIGVTPMFISTLVFGHFDHIWVAFTIAPLCIVAYIFTRYESSYPKSQWFSLLLIIGFMLGFCYKEYATGFGYWISIIPFILCNIKYKYRKQQDKLTEFNYDSKSIDRDDKIEKILNNW